MFSRRVRVSSVFFVFLLLLCCREGIFFCFFVFSGVSDENGRADEIIVTIKIKAENGREKKRDAI